MNKQQEYRIKVLSSFKDFYWGDSYTDKDKAVDDARKLSDLGVICIVVPYPEKEGLNE